MIEMMIGALVITILLVLSFVAGLKLSDYYAAKRESAVEYALKRQYTRLRAGADADDPVGPYVYDDTGT